MAAKPGRIVHHIPGRLRIKVLGSQEGSEYFAAVKHAIGELPGVDSVSVNPPASSIVVRYKPSETHLRMRLEEDPQIGAWLSLAGADPIDDAAADAITAGMAYLQRHSRLAETIVSGAEHLDANLRQASAGYLDLKVLLPLGVLAATTLHKRRSRGTPMWVTVSTFAFNAFLTLHRRRIDAPIVEIDYRPSRRA